jgi:hypothetical protein
MPQIEAFNCGAVDPTLVKFYIEFGGFSAEQSLEDLKLWEIATGVVEISFRSGFLADPFSSRIYYFGIPELRSTRWVR